MTTNTACTCPVPASASASRPVAATCPGCARELDGGAGGALLVWGVGPCALSLVVEAESEPRLARFVPAAWAAEHAIGGVLLGDAWIVALDENQVAEGDPDDGYGLLDRDPAVAGYRVLPVPPLPPVIEWDIIEEAL